MDIQIIATMVAIGIALMAVTDVHIQIIAAMAVIGIALMAAAHLSVRRSLQREAASGRRTNRDRSVTVGDSTWYEAKGRSDAARTKRAWDARVARAEGEGRLFVIPGDGYATTWDHLDTWSPFAKGLAHQQLYLRIVHNHELRDTTNDAIALEFATADDKATFLSRVPADGPVPFVFADMLSGETRALHDRLIGRNREIAAVDGR